MPHEVISLHVGQCGNQLGRQVWQQLCAEHYIGYDGYNNLFHSPYETSSSSSNQHFEGGQSNNDSYLSISHDSSSLPTWGNMSIPFDHRDAIFSSSTTSGRFTPRAILFDTEPNVLTKGLAQHCLRDLFDTSCIYIHPDGAGSGNNWLAGYEALACASSGSSAPPPPSSSLSSFQSATSAKQRRHASNTVSAFVSYSPMESAFTFSTFAQEEVASMLSSQLERCETPDGFQLYHGMAGGAGSGFGSQLLELTRELYPRLTIQTMSCFDDIHTSTITVAPYNTILTLKRLIELVDSVIVIDNSFWSTLTTPSLSSQSSSLLSSSSISKTSSSGRYLPSNPALSRVAGGGVGNSGSGGVHLSSFIDASPYSNNSIASTLCAATAIYRYHGATYLPFRDWVRQLSPFPRCHFTTTSALPYQPGVWLGDAQHQTQQNQHPSIDFEAARLAGIALPPSQTTVSSSSSSSSSSSPYAVVPQASAFRLTSVQNSILPMFQPKHRHLVPPHSSSASMLSSYLSLSISLGVHHPAALQSYSANSEAQLSLPSHHRQHQHQQQQYHNQQQSKSSSLQSQLSPSPNSPSISNDFVDAATFPDLSPDELIKTVQLLDNRTAISFCCPPPSSLYGIPISLLPTPVSLLKLQCPWIPFHPPAHQQHQQAQYGQIALASQLHNESSTQQSHQTRQPQHIPVNSAIMLANSTEIRHFLQAHVEKFALLRQRGAFLDGYISRTNIFDDPLSELDDSLDCVTDVIAEYTWLEQQANQQITSAASSTISPLYDFSLSSAAILPQSDQNE